MMEMPLGALTESSINSRMNIFLPSSVFSYWESIAAASVLISAEANLYFVCRYTNYLIPQNVCNKHITVVNLPYPTTSLL
jgi:hypothetical protein